MRVLFVYFNKEFRPRIPYSLALLETIVKRGGHETRVFDTSFYEEFIDPWEFNHVKAGIWKVVENLAIEPKRTDPYADLRAAVESFRPGLLAFSFYATNVEMQRRLLTPLKRDFPGLPVLAGGVQACLNPEGSLGEPYVDLLCYGEGEALIVEVCDRLGRGLPLDGIKGLWRKADGGILRSGLTDLTDIDTLPTLDLDSYDPVQIHGLYEGRAYRMGHVESTRGCPYRCSYCGSGALRTVYGEAGQPGYVRHKSPAKLVAECRELARRYRLEMFYFQDGTFTCKPLRIFEELAPAFRREVGLPFIALVRPETITPRVAELLALMGCVHVSIGVESGVERYRREVLQRDMTNEQIVRAIRQLRERRIHVSAYNMIGLPGMDRAHVFETIRLNRAARPDSAIVSIFIPFPDNELTQALIRKGLIAAADIRSHTGTVPNVPIREMGEAEITGLFNTFNLYVKLPEFLYPLIRRLERASPATDRIRRLLYRLLR